MQKKFGCFVSAGSVLDGRPMWIVPQEFVQQAEAHIARTGRPYLAHHDDFYRFTVIARPAPHGRYEMYGADVRERTVPTWRQLYWHRYADNLTRDAFRARFAFADEQWDTPAESAAADAMVLGGWRVSRDEDGAGFPLDGLDLPRFRADGSSKDLGYVFRLDGSLSGVGGVLVTSSAFALSCLQFWLDELRAGVRIRVDGGGER